MDNAGRAIAGMGGAMAQAGRGMGTGAGIVSGAGGLVAAAGHGIAMAGRALGGSGGAGSSAGTSGAKAQESSGDGLPRPHWVLRDKSGTPVQAEAGPYYEPNAKYFQTNATPACVWVSTLGQRSIGLSFMLTTGRLAIYPQCAGGISNNADWHAPRSYYLDASCAGQGVRRLGQPRDYLRRRRPLLPRRAGPIVRDCVPVEHDLTEVRTPNDQCGIAHSVASTSQRHRESPAEPALLARTRLLTAGQP